MLPKEDRYMMTEQELKDKIVGLLGGRVAEEIVLGEVSTGASNDFQRATGLARKMVMEFGMSKLGPLQYGESQQGQVFLGRDIGHERNYSEAVAHDIDQEVQRIIKEQYERCTELLTKYRDQLELIAKTLLEVETLTAEQIQELVDTGELSEESMKKARDANEEANQAAEDKISKNNEASKDDVKVHIQSKKEDENKFVPTEKEEKKKEQDEDQKNDKNDDKKNE